MNDFKGSIETNTLTGSLKYFKGEKGDSVFECWLQQDGNEGKTFEDFMNEVNIDLTGYATIKYVDEQINNAQLGGGDVNLDGYAKLTDIPTKTSQLTNDNNFITTIPDEYITNDKLNAKGYATETFVTNKISEASLSGGEVDLSGYAKKEELHTHDNKDVLDTISKVDVHRHGNMSTLNSITSYKVSEWNNKSDFSGDYNDLTNKPTIPTKTSQLANDNNFLTSVPSEYITETELNEKGYLTEHQDISKLALKTELHSHVNMAVLSTITNSKINQWNNKSNFSGSYNDLTNKPTIPKEYVLPEASSETLGGVKVGAGLSITNGVLSATGGGVADSVEWSNIQNKPNIPTKTSELTNDNGFLTSIPSEYVTETELNEKGYLTEHQDISKLALKTELHSHVNMAVLSTITNSKINQWNNKSNFSGSYNDLTNKPTIPKEYVLPEASSETLGGVKVGAGLSITNGVLSATGGGVADSVEWSNIQNKPNIPTKTSELTNDNGFLTSIPSEYVTETELNEKGYLTEHQSLDGYATTSQIPTTLPANGGNADTVNNIRIVALNQSEYDAIASKDSNTIYIIKEV